MAQVKIQVQGADGKYRGTLFKDGPGYENRWTGAPKPSLQEVMVCSDDIATGEWFLIEYVLPRKIIGEEARDDLFDEESTCCRRTPVQALHWFSQQAFGPPPALVDRVRQFAGDWSAFLSSQPARGLLATLLARGWVDETDDAFVGDGEPLIALLQRLELTHACSGATRSFSVNSLVQDMGVDGYINWMNSHLARVGSIIGDTPSVTQNSPGAPVVEHTDELGADTTLLVGWAEILPVLGYDPKDRRMRERVKELNASTSGPLKLNGRRRTIINRSVLILWWLTVADRTADVSDRKAKAERQKRPALDDLANPGVRKEEGFHAWDRPNVRKRRST